ncbi:BT_3928 family protein [Sediminibacterium soli]|uniref:BT_3928 family protein n=1 Tax=Sediminibacterium soli TaxID=2698829 RepID=UPI00137AB046|nr:BT_3928 family protein [Sediminibacterium soli]NCI46231.1 DoxX family protein [Sediminibacterium soli]
MKTTLLIIRWIVGLLFIFSGLVKVNDPLGLSYKMQEFFEVWHWTALHDYTLPMAFVMNVFEVVAGVAVIIGWRMRLFSWLLLLLIVFFTFLTGYALFSGKIKTCGCFGDCLPLTPAQSFGKDIFLLVLILVLFVMRKKIQTSVKPVAAAVLLFLATAGSVSAQLYVMKHLPFVDCLPYKPGNNLLDEMKTPVNAVPDSISIVFTYEKNGRKLEFDQTAFPADFDSTYKFIDRKDRIVKKGNGLQARIVDFSLLTVDGQDTTMEILGQPQPYILVFARDMENVNEWIDGFHAVVRSAADKQIPVMIVTADADKAMQSFKDVTILKCDATVIKTAARVVPTYFMMQKANIIDKFSYADKGKIFARINSVK